MVFGNRPSGRPRTSPGGSAFSAAKASLVAMAKSMTLEDWRDQSVGSCPDRQELEARPTTIRRCRRLPRRVTLAGRSPESPPGTFRSSGRLATTGPRRRRSGAGCFKAADLLAERRLSRRRREGDRQLRTSTDLGGMEYRRVVLDEGVVWNSVVNFLQGESQLESCEM